MTTPTRLGDLIRVADALRPGPEQLKVIAELLPDHRGLVPIEARIPYRSPAVVHPTPSAEAKPTLAKPATRRRRRTRPRVRVGLASGKRSLLPEPGRWERVWWITVAILVTVLSLLWATGRFGGGAWLVTVVALLTARPLWWHAGRNWSAWWSSAQRHSSASYEDLQNGGGGGEPEGDSVTLTRTRWQPPPPGVPLVRASQQRAVAALLAGRLVPGKIDVLATVREMASRRPLTRIPRRPRWSTSQGLHLHVDIGPAFEPFRNDVDQLRAALVAIASTHAIVELGFDGDPGLITWPRRIVGRRGRLELADRLPPSGTRVLVVTDLGIAVPRSGSPPEPDHFLDHHRLLSQAGCRVHYLVPYPPERWPPRLTELPILYWSDDLGAVEVLAGIRRRTRARVPLHRDETA